MVGYYSAHLQAFLQTSDNEVLAQLQRAHAGEFRSTSDLATIAWSDSLPQVRAGLLALADHPDAEAIQLVFEYKLPRLRSRADLVVLHPGVAVVLEMKSGTSSSQVAEARVQAARYRQELKDFHEASRFIPLAPLAVGAGFPEDLEVADWTSPDVVPVGSVPFERLGHAIAAIIAQGRVKPETEVDALTWIGSRYFPVPPITQAITELFERREIGDIAHSQAGQDEVEGAVNRIVEIAREASALSQKVLLVLTGVPGAGKTLVGLSGVASLQREFGDLSPVAFLSGNGPLVKVLQEVLVRNMKQSETRRRAPKQLAQRFIQEVHLYVSELLLTNNVPAERVVFYDEAQRAWSAAHNVKKKNKLPGFNDHPLLRISEAEQLLTIADRHSDWAIVVALVGGGQEIHSGEAGLQAWGEAMLKFPDWRLITSPEAIVGGAGVAQQVLFERDRPEHVESDPRLHLSVSKRSYETELHADWVNALLVGDQAGARSIADRSRRKVYVCRDLETVRRWLQERGVAPYRSGLVASSGGVRLRSQGLEPPTFTFLSGYPYEKWFLDPPERVLSSGALEVALSEFEVQGLELDYVGVCWGGDLNASLRGWVPRKFDGRSQRWVEEADPTKRRLTLNKYRVLLTRFRKGMVIFLPSTYRHPADHVADDDRTARWLVDAGCVPL